MQTDLIELAVAIAIIAVVIFLLRWLSRRSRNKAPATAFERMGGEAEVEARPRRQRRRPRPGEAEAGTPPEEVAGREPEVVVAERAEELTTDDEAHEAYKVGLAKTRGGGFVSRLGKLFGKKKIDADTLEELEAVLLGADIGPHATGRIVDGVRRGLSKNELEHEDKIWARIRSTSKEILAVDAPPVDTAARQPFVLLVLGVNGVGKTTTIGKLASKWKQEGKKVLLAAGDTFRAAATEQLEEWGKRADVPVVKGSKDPSAVIFDAIKRGVDEHYDIVICDTAGRLHTSSGLMDELKKIRRVAEKAMPGAPHETWMVLDATTGQNAVEQARIFKQDVEITGIVLTKLDGSSKGGVVLRICDELKVPVRYVGVGEKIGDLRPFDPIAFVDALYSAAGTSEAA